MADAPRCCVCGDPAQHEAAGPATYCCRCFNHDWPEQRLIAGQECGMERALIPPPPPTYRWQWKAGRPAPDPD